MSIDEGKGERQLNNAEIYNFLGELYFRLH